MSRPFDDTPMGGSNGAFPAAKRQKTDNGFTSQRSAVYNLEEGCDELYTLPQHVTQPTQIIENSLAASSSPRLPEVQVPASSPFRSGVASSLPRTSPPHNSLQRNGGGFASAMAPAGTVFRNPYTKPSPQTRGFIDLSDDDGPAYMGSSDGEGSRNANIRPSTFQPRADSTTPLSRPASSTSGMAKFKSIVSNAVHKPGAPSKQDPVGTLYAVKSNTAKAPIDLTKVYIPDDPLPKPRRDAMASAYGGSPRPRPAIQSRPEKPKPIEDISLDSITDHTLRGKVTRLGAIMPSTTVLMRRDALLACKGNFDDAAAMLTDNEPVNLLSDDELAPSSNLPNPSTTTFRGVNNVTSINDRYGKAATATARKIAVPTSTSSQTEATPEAKPRRKLVQGRKHASPEKPPSPKPAPISLDSDVEGGYDSGVGSQMDVDVELEDRVLKLMNKCTAGDLSDLAGITKEVAEKFLAQRPFRSLDLARKITDTSKTKGGKASKRAPMGDKIVDAAVSMTKGYEGVDKLVNSCNRISKPIQAEMSKWGFNVFGAAKNGELELTSLNIDEDDKDSIRDSGIGTPSSTNASQTEDANEDEIRQMTRKERSSKFIQKPANMSDSLVLKDYQVVGINWLALLYKEKLSCILADEMGLGKTCQVIAFLSHLATIGIRGPHLVIVPGSTLENWLREFERFSPGLVAVPYHGKQAEREEMAENVLERGVEIDVVVTTYDTCVRPADTKFLKKLNANVCVYDEGHQLKNPLTKRYQSLVKIPAQFRLLLTGTPLQNNLQELAALLGFILPGVFKENYDDLEFIFKHKAKTSDSDHSALLSSQRMNRAKQMLAPFVLRRKKHQVLKHLPSKTCRVEYCDMHPVQREIYKEFEEPAAERARLRLEGLKVPKADDNNPFMQLRKAAIHPQLFRRHFDDKKVHKMASILQRTQPNMHPDKYKLEYLLEEMKGFSDYVLHLWCRDYPELSKFDVEDRSWFHSGKVLALVKLVKQYKANGDRVLIFSQFQLVLDIIEAVLNSENIYFTRIDGSTDISSRQPLIDNFRDDESITAFLLTTKAGGTGLNLMMANKVIIFDGSLNPQDDVQAENRAHRVGQTRNVEVVRLVTRETIEEQILRLGESKLALDRGVAGEDEKGVEDAGEKDVAKMFLETLKKGKDDPAEKKDEAENKDVLKKKDDNITEAKGKERQVLVSDRKKSQAKDKTT